MEKLNKENAHSVLRECWCMFNAIRKNPSEEGWETCVNTANNIAEKNPEPFYKDWILAVVVEADNEYKLKTKKEKLAQYKLVAKAYNEIWALMEAFIDNQEVFNTKGEEMISEYNKNNNIKFAWKLSSMLKKYFSQFSNEKGSFMKVSYNFYEKYKNGISETDAATALAMAEDIISIYPDYMLQMMNLYNQLKLNVNAA